MTQLDAYRGDELPPDSSVLAHSLHNECTASHLMPFEQCLGTLQSFKSNSTVKLDQYLLCMAGAALHVCLAGEWLADATLVLHTDMHSHSCCHGASTRPSSMRPSVRSHQQADAALWGDALEHVVHSAHTCKGEPAVCHNAPNVLYAFQNLCLI